MTSCSTFPAHVLWTEKEEVCKLVGRCQKEERCEKRQNMNLGRHTRKEEHCVQKKEEQEEEETSRKKSPGKRTGGCMRKTGHYCERHQI